MRLRYDDCDEGCVLRGQQSEVVAMQDVTSQAPRAVIDVPVLDLYADPNQPRRNFPAAALRELADSIAVRITHPLVVRPRAGGGYWIVDGERRWRAAALLGRPALPCLVDTIDDPLEVAAVQITTSAQREQLSAVEVAEFLAELRDRRQLSHNELAAELAKLGLQKFGAMKLEKLVKLADLPRWAKKLSQDGALSDSLAGSLVAWSTHRSFMDALGSELQAAAALTGQITAGELQETIRRVLEAVGVDLNARHPAELVRRFPLERCRGQCACYHRFQKADWCVHRERFLARNAEAQEASTVPAADEPAPDARDNPDPTAVPPLGVQV
ncbi:MAG TPA: hypothetical protein DEH78_05185, partial [Solibacterales bacterium]|nr:hypothetical protein [Bryobacterales bacterium]